MDDIKVLEEIGLKKVSKATHIEVKNLQSIIDSDFEKLNRATAIGFIKIISREYNLQLDDWVDKANQYWNELEEVEGKPKIFIVQKPKIFPKFLLTLISIVMLAVILYGAYIFLNQRLGFFETPLLNSDTNFTYEQTPVVDEAKKSLNTEKKVVDEVNASEQNTTQASDVNADINASDSNETATVKNEVLQSDGIDANKTIQPQNSVEIKSSDTNSLISPNTKLWIGIVYLDNFKRKSFLGDGNFTIDASKDQLITTGHGDFNLYFKGKVTKFNSQQPMKFLIKDGNLSQISVEKFKELNRGSLW